MRSIRGGRGRLAVAAVGAGTLVASVAAVTVLSWAALGGSTAAIRLGRPAGAAASPPAVIRVNLLGYPTGAAKVGYLMTTAPATEARFVIRCDGRTALSGRVGASAGPWNHPYAYVYPIDFSRLVRPGTCALLVPGGGGSATSPEFRVAPAADLYSAALANTAYFYGEQRDGPRYLRSPLRTAPAHLHDANTMTYPTPPMNANGVFPGDLHPTGTRADAAGGWWDAGDYLKFVETTSYTVDVMLAGVRDFPTVLGPRATGATSIADEAMFGLDWLSRMWDDRTGTLYYQVGIATGNAHLVGDHDLWRLPQLDDTYGGTDPAYRYIRYRPVLRAAPAGARVSPNLAGRLAADFALGAQLLARSDPARAASLLRAARHVFGLADTSPGRLLTAAPYDFYPETQWRDDLELGATEIARALGAGPAATPYLQAAARWARAYIATTNDGDPLNLYDVSGLAHFELARTMAQQPGHPLAVTRADLVADLGRQLEKASAQAARDPFGFGFPWAAYDTATHGFGLSVLAAEYDALTGSARYGEQSTGWLGNVLGANAWGSSFVIGDGSEFPHCPQHQVANLVGSLDGSPPVLRGAVVEGPNSYATAGTLPNMRRCPPGGADRFAPYNSTSIFRDRVQSYSTVEPAIDLTASSLLAFAWQIAPPAHR